jgi:AraC family transcriptional regulator
MVIDMAMTLQDTIEKPSARPFSTPSAVRSYEAPHARDRKRGGFATNTTAPRRPQLEIAAPCLSEPLVEFFPANAVSRRTLIARGMTAEIVDGVSQEHVKSEIRSPNHLLIAYERGARREGETSIENLPSSSLRDVTHKLVFVPAGHAYHDSHAPRVNMSAIYFYFSPAILSGQPGADEDAVTMPPRLFFENAMVWDTALKMKALLADGNDDNHTYFEALGFVLAHEIMRLSSTARSSAAPTRGGLAAWQQRTATAYIEEHLSEAISLETLAKLVRLSPYYFCRTFKQSFGVPPHRYHSNRRIERAKELLTERKQSVTDVALAVGFGETSSFSAAFRKATGVTPTEYQRSAG